ncbi:MAG: glycine zipper domain-containing protein [Candidatus Omnitrophota bacterium]
MAARLTVSMIAALFLLTGCESLGPKTKTGAVAGGLIGATAGGIIGYQADAPFVGAAIGAATGAVAGGLIGSAMDESDKKAAEINPNHIPVPKIAEMGSQNTPDSVIIGEIQRTHSVYNLNSETIAYLKQNKVSDKVIDHMLNTAAAAKS